jgi:hypothetical protein
LTSKTTQAGGPAVDADLEELVGAAREEAKRDKMTADKKYIVYKLVDNYCR